MGDVGILAENELRHRILVQTGLGLARRERRDVNRITALGRRDPSNFDKGTETHDDLSVERVGFGQALVEIAAQQHAVAADQFDQPGLAVMRVRRKNRIAQRIEPGIGGAARIDGPRRDCGGGRAHHAPGGATPHQRKADTTGTKDDRSS
ncbi:MAG: hypothetical protein B7Y43_06525 [Sphingomonas sp. 28-62-20]|nr:MAG: hypothetical protein B7Y43_06525 [Sphingomonas sp. 28-62-20]